MNQINNLNLLKLVLKIFKYGQKSLCWSNYQEIETEFRYKLNK